MIFHLKAKCLTVLNWLLGKRIICKQVPLECTWLVSLPSPPCKRIHHVSYIQKTKFLCILRLKRVIKKLCFISVCICALTCTYSRQWWWCLWHNWVTRYMSSNLQTMFQEKDGAYSVIGIEFARSCAPTPSWSSACQPLR